MPTIPDVPAATYAGLVVAGGDLYAIGRADTEDASTSVIWRFDQGRWGQVGNGTGCAGRRRRPGERAVDGGFVYRSQSFGVSGYTFTTGTATCRTFDSPAAPSLQPAGGGWRRWRLPVGRAQGDRRQHRPIRQPRRGHRDALPAAVARRRRCGPERFSAGVAGAAENGSALPIGDFVNISLCDVIEGETKKFASTAVYQNTSPSSAAMPSRSSSARSLLLSRTALTFSAISPASPTKPRTRCMNKLVSGFRLAGCAQRSALIVVAVHSPTVAIGRSPIGAKVSRRTALETFTTRMAASVPRAIRPRSRNQITGPRWLLRRVRPASGH